MLRRHQVDGLPVATVAAAFGALAAHLYQAQAALQRSGLPGLMPGRPGSWAAWLSAAIVAFVRALKDADPTLTTPACLRDPGSLRRHRASPQPGARPRPPQAIDAGGLTLDGGPGRLRRLREQVLHPASRDGDIPGGRAVLVREGPGSLDRDRLGRPGRPRPPPAEARLPPAAGGIAGAIAALILSLPKEDEHGRGQGHGRAPGARCLSLRPAIDAAPGGRERREHPSASMPCATVPQLPAGQSSGSRSSTAISAAPVPRWLAGTASSGWSARSRWARRASSWGWRSRGWPATRRLGEAGGAVRHHRHLLLDEDATYDATSFNDRLLLGLKGTMSEAELHIPRAPAWRPPQQGPSRRPGVCAAGRSGPSARRPPRARPRCPGAGHAPARVRDLRADRLGAADPAPPARGRCCSRAAFAPAPTAAS